MEIKHEHLHSCIVGRYRRRRPGRPVADNHHIGLPVPFVWKRTMAQPATGNTIVVPGAVTQCSGVETDGVSLFFLVGP